MKQTGAVVEEPRLISGAAVGKSDLREVGRTGMSTVFCPACGQVLPGDSSFCEKCGANVGKATPAPAKGGGLAEAVTKRITGLGISACGLLALIPSAAVVFGLWLLGDWFYSHDIWVLGALCRVVCWVSGVGLALMVVVIIGMAVYSVVKGVED